MGKITLQNCMVQTHFQGKIKVKCIWSWRAQRNHLKE